MIHTEKERNWHFEIYTLQRPSRQTSKGDQNWYLTVLTTGEFKISVDPEIPE
jgi:hypothetical protein